MDPAWTTLIIVILSIGFPALADVWLYWHSGAQYTITCQIRKLHQYCIWFSYALVAAFCLLLGHFFLCPVCVPALPPDAPLAPIPAK